MSPEYEAWIEAYVARVGSTFGRCAEATAEMVEAFPELTRVPGHVECPWGRRGHWWCTTAEGEIVDPTAAQFPSIWEYDPYKEGDDVRLGSCMDCGASLWGPPGSSRTFCGPECEAATQAYLAEMRGR